MANKRWRTGVIHPCGGDIEVWVSYHKKEKYTLYEYNCVKCGETGKWQELVTRMGKMPSGSNRKDFKKNNYKKKYR